jgi:uncharacterized protein YqgC (DUF456 family)
MPAQNLTLSGQLQSETKKAMLRSRLFLLGLRVLAALVVAAAIGLPFFNHAKRNVAPLTNPSLVVPTTHDMAQHLVVMEQFDKVLRAGTLYPRWLPDANNGYGLAWTNYYPPGLYFVTSLINAPVKDWRYTLLIVSILGLAASGLFFYMVSRLFYGWLASGVAALLYMVSPYHALDLYWRGAIPEFMGFVLLPPIVYFAFKLGSSGNGRYFAGLGFFHGIYLLTHFPVAYLMTVALAFYAISRAVRERDWKIALRIGLGIAIALLLGSIYWVPAALEANLVAEHFSRLFPYHKSYVTLMPGGDDFAELINVSFAVQTLTLIVSIWLLYSVRDSASNISKVSVDPGRTPQLAKRTQTRQWVLMAIATTFMCTSLSYYVSRFIPKVDSVSFAWRWLVIATFFTSLVAAAAIDRLTIPSSLSLRMSWACRFALAAAIALNVWCTVENVIIPTRSRPQLVSPPSFLEPGFIPAGATQPQSMPAGPAARLDPPSGEVQIIRWDPLHREVRIDSGQPAILKLRTYNFPGWEARVDGQPKQILSDATGAQIVDILPGQHTVEVSFVNTPPRTLGGVLTGAAFLLICGLVSPDLVRRRRVSLKGTTPRESNLSEALPADRSLSSDEEKSCSLER